MLLFYLLYIYNKTYNLVGQVMHFDFLQNYLDYSSHFAFQVILDFIKLANALFEVS